MNFQKNQFFKTNPTKIAGNKVLSKNTPFELTKQFINKNKIDKNKIYKEQPLTPEQRLEQQKNKNHFFKP